MRHQTELLAPAGSFESLRAAVNAGADAAAQGSARGPMLRIRMKRACARPSSLPICTAAICI